MYTAITLALAALGSALPSPPPTPSKFFSLAMKVDGSLVSLNAVDNGTVGNKVLEAERLSVYPGTPGMSMQQRAVCSRLIDKCCSVPQQHQRRRIQGLEL